VNTFRPFQVEKLKWGLRMDVIAALLLPSQLGRIWVSETEGERLIKNEERMKV